jgi:dTDP-glucose 4,6-dehydratase
MIDGTMLCLENKKAIGEIFNIGNPKGTVTITSLAEKILLLCKTKSKIKYIPKNYVDVELRIPSIEKAEKILGFKPRVSLDEGIVKSFAWYKKYLKK